MVAWEGNGGSEHTGAAGKIKKLRTPVSLHCTIRHAHSKPDSRPCAPSPSRLGHCLSVGSMNNEPRNCCEQFLLGRHQFPNGTLNRQVSVQMKFAMAVGVTVVQSISRPLEIGRPETAGSSAGIRPVPTPADRHCWSKCKLRSRKKTPVAFGSTASGRRCKFCIKPPGGPVGPAEGSQEYVE